MSSDDNLENENFEKKFKEIVNSDDLKDISKSFENNLSLGIKELLMIQQALCDTISHIADILIDFNKNPENRLQKNDEKFELIGSLYKICEDFNDYMIECSEDIIFAFEDDEDDEDDILSEIEESEFEDDEDGDI